MLGFCENCRDMVECSVKERKKQKTSKVRILNI